MHFVFNSLRTIELAVISQENENEKTKSIKVIPVESALSSRSVRTWHSGSQLINEACDRTWMALSKRKIRILKVGSASSTHTQPGTPSRMFQFSDVGLCECGLCSMFVFDSKMSYLFISQFLCSYYLFLSALYSRMQSRRVRKTEHATKRQRHYDHYLHEKDTIELRQRDSHEQTKFPSLFFFCSPQVHVNRTFIAVMNR